jgi:hypothetical protein
MYFYRIHTYVQSVLCELILRKKISLFTLSLMTIAFIFFVICIQYQYCRYFCFLQGSNIYKLYSFCPFPCTWNGYHVGCRRGNDFCKEHVILLASQISNRTSFPILQDIREKATSVQTRNENIEQKRGICY